MPEGRYAVALTTTRMSTFSFENSEDLNKLMRTIACLRFKQITIQKIKIRQGTLTTNELNNSLNKIITLAQIKEFKFLYLL